MLVSEAGAVDDDGDSGDLSLGLQCNDGENLVGEGDKLEIA